VLALRGALALDPAEVQAVIITGQGDRQVDQARAAGLEVIIEPSLCAPIRPASDLRALRQLTALFAARDCDVVPTHCAKAGAVGRLAARQAGVPRVVHTYHGFPFHPFQARPVRQAYISVERRLGRLTDVGLCVGSAVAAEAVRRELIAPERVATIGVCAAAPDQPAGPETRQRARLALGLPAGAPVIGVVGRLTYQKAPEDFVAALRALGRPEVIGVWVGSGELADRVRRCAAGLPPGQFRLPGERTDVPDILPAFDLFALPSRYEGLPTAIVEAMSCGLPVVATSVNAVPDLVIPGQTGLLVPPRRPARLAAALAYLLDAPAEAARLGAAGREHVTGRYGPATLAAALMAAYDPTSPERYEKSSILASAPRAFA
jgi:glycosyltransferase involved in cell wall biosynthesis